MCENPGKQATKQTLANMIFELDLGSPQGGNYRACSKGADPEHPTIARCVL